MFKSLLKKCSALGAVLLVLSLSTVTEAAPIALFNTGVDAGGSLLAAGDLDPHWNITNSPDPIFTAPGSAITALNHPVWLANGPDSNWISVTADGNDTIAGGTYIYETTFDLTGLDATTAEISGGFAVDTNLLNILLNGSGVGITQSGDLSTAFNPFSIDNTANFNAGVNTLTFRTNRGGGAETAGPHGFRAELSGTANVIPEPSSFALASLSMMGLAGLRRRNHSK